MSPPRVSFQSSGPFHQELKRRVEAHFEETGVSQRGNAWMALKSVTLFAWLGASYGLLVFAPVTWWQGVLLAISAGMATAGIGFAVMHDANHGAYVSGKKGNRLLGLTLDLIGGSSYVWQWKHNVYHHTYTNLVGMDADLEGGQMLRMAPETPRRPWHRFQFLYAWILYGLLPIKWHFFDDFNDLATGRIGGQKLPRPGKGELAMALTGKAIFYSWALVVPLLFHPVWVVAVYFLLSSFVLGLMLGITFQLAHVVDNVEFPARIDGEKMPTEWAVHQLETTTDFARNNRLLSWYVGGLNFQVEHHLFPKVCHLHHREVSKIVEATCNEFGVRHRAYPTLGAALIAHARWLYALGREPVVATEEPAVSLRAA